MMIFYNNHKIEVITQADIFGTEIVKYDDTLVSKKKSLFGDHHIFSVIEDGQLVQYEVEIKPKFFSNWTIARPSFFIRREGKIIFSD
jgi:hypothetical protein